MRLRARGKRIWNVTESHENGNLKATSLSMTQHCGQEQGLFWQWREVIRRHEDGYDDLTEEYINS